MFCDPCDISATSDKCTAWPLLKPITSGLYSSALFIQSLVTISAVVVPSAIWPVGS